jgi:hypothetical protein
VNRSTVTVFSACHTAENVPELPMYGLCATVSRNGVPGVVGMQAAFFADSSIAFSKELYSELDTGEPLDAAVTRGRIELSRGLRDPSSLEAFVPVLYQSREIRFGRIPESYLQHSRGAEYLESEARWQKRLVRIWGGALGILSIAVALLLWLLTGRIGFLSKLFAFAGLGTWFATWLVARSLGLIRDNTQQAREELRALENQIVAARDRVSAESAQEYVDLDRLYRRKVHSLYAEVPRSWTREGRYPQDEVTDVFIGA